MKATLSPRFLVIVVTSLFWSACTTFPVMTSEAPMNMVNPASAYCEQQGGQVEIRTDQDGNQYGMCIFADKSECDEWAFFRKECQPGEQNPMEIPAEVTGVRDIALAYLVQKFGENAPPVGAAWSGEQNIPPELVGSALYQFSSEDWQISITYPIVAPEAVVYTITVDNPTAGFHWQGQIDAEGQVREE
jgi:putative hemolysin